MADAVQTGRNLLQDAVWLTKDGQLLELEDMTESHRTNLLRMLERKAERIKDAYLLSFLASPWPHEDTMAALGFEAEFDDLLETDPVEWLHKLPLPAKLIALGAEPTP